MNGVSILCHDVLTKFFVTCYGHVRTFGRSYEADDTCIMCAQPMAVPARRRRGAHRPIDPDRSLQSGAAVLPGGPATGAADRVRGDAAGLPAGERGRPGRPAGPVRAQLAAGPPAPG